MKSNKPAVPKLYTKKPQEKSEDKIPIKSNNRSINRDRSPPIYEPPKLAKTPVKPNLQPLLANPPSKSPQLMTPQEKENTTQFFESKKIQATGSFRYPHILDHALKRNGSKPLQQQNQFLNIQKTWQAEDKEFDTDVSKTEIEQKTVMTLQPPDFKFDIRSPSSATNQSSLNKIVASKSQSILHESAYVDYIITNKEVSNFLKKNFIFSAQNDFSTQPVSPTRPFTPTSKFSSKQIGTISPNSKRLICDTWDRVPLAFFLRVLIDEFKDIIEEHHLSESHIHKLKMLLKSQLQESESPNYLSLNKLQIYTKQLGLIGLMIQAIKELKPCNMGSDCRSDLISPPDESAAKGNSEFSTFFNNDVKNIMQQLQDYAHDTSWQIEQTVNEKFNGMMRKLVVKCREAEKLLQSVSSKVTDNYDLFQHESKTKDTIFKLKNDVKEKDSQIDNLQNKINDIQNVYEQLKKENKKLQEREKYNQEKIQMLEDQVNKLQESQDQFRLKLIVSSIDESDGQVLSSSPPKNNLFERSLISATKNYQGGGSSRVSPVRPGVPHMDQSSPFNLYKAKDDHDLEPLIKLLFEALQAWELSSIQEEQKFSQILLAAENTQVSFQYYQLIPTLKTIPGFTQFIQRSQFYDNIFQYWIQGIIKSSQQLDSITSSRSNLSAETSLQSTLLTDLYEKSLGALPLIVSDNLNDSHAYNLLLLFLKLTICIQTTKLVFNNSHLKEWLSQVSKKNNLQEGQLKFFQCFVNSIIHLVSFKVNMLPQTKQWNQMITQPSIQSAQDNNTTVKILEHPLLEVNVRKLLQSIQQKYQGKPILAACSRVLNIFYNESPAEDCIQLMMKEIGTEQAPEKNMVLSKIFLNIDAVNMVVFPYISNQIYTLNLLKSLLAFKCPGQYYVQYTNQVCRKENVEILIDIAIQFFNKQNAFEEVVKVWEALGAIAKSVGLKGCSERLNLIVKLYGQHQPYITNATISQNVQIVSKNLSS